MNTLPGLLGFARQDSPLFILNFRKKSTFRPDFFCFKVDPKFPKSITLAVSMMGCATRRRRTKVDPCGGWHACN
jgi:hypothetical protein